MRLMPILLAWLLFVLPAYAFETGTQECETALDCARNSVVSLLPDWPPGISRNEEPEGSGIVVGNGTLIATADHVLGLAKSARIRTAEGRVIKAEIVLRDPTTDIAFLGIEKPLTAFGRPADISIGEKSCALGNSFGLGVSVSCGVISAKQVSGTGFNPVEDFHQTDASVNPGMSGGALVNEEGRLVGMLSAIFTKQSDANIGMNFAVSGQLLEKVLNDYQEHGVSRHRATGVLVRPGNPVDHDGWIGAKVVRLEDGSIADKAGIETDDLIISVGQRRMLRAGAFEAAVVLAKAGLELDVLVLRDNDFHNLVMIPE
jgi:S1-C subfamily serine protease